MNKVNVYGIYDHRAEQLINVFISVGDSTAKRSFLDLISSPHPSLFTSHFSDFSLAKFAVLESDRFKPFDYTLEFLLKGSDFSRAELINMRIKNAELNFPGNEDLKKEILNNE